MNECELFPLFAVFYANEWLDRFKESFASWKAINKNSFCISAIQIYFHFSCVFFLCLYDEDGNYKCLKKNCFHFLWPKVHKNGII